MLKRKIILPGRTTTTPLVSVTLSVATPLCPSGIAYRRAYGLSLGRDLGCLNEDANRTLARLLELQERTGAFVPRPALIRGHV